MIVINKPSRQQLTLVVGGHRDREGSRAQIGLIAYFHEEACSYKTVLSLSFYLGLIAFFFYEGLSIFFMTTLSTFV